LDIFLDRLDLPNSELGLLLLFLTRFGLRLDHANPRCDAITAAPVIVWDRGKLWTGAPEVKDEVASGTAEEFPSLSACFTQIVVLHISLLPAITIPVLLEVGKFQKVTKAQVLVVVVFRIVTATVISISCFVNGNEVWESGMISIIFMQNKKDVNTKDPKGRNVPTPQRTFTTTPSYHLPLKFFWNL
jgi:hypothetical protein